jgi:hypothetical protein
MYIKNIEHYNNGVFMGVGPINFSGQVKRKIQKEIIKYTNLLFKQIFLPNNISF